MGKARWKQSHMMAAVVVVEEAAEKTRSWVGRGGRVVEVVEVVEG